MMTQQNSPSHSATRQPKHSNKVDKPSLETVSTRLLNVQTVLRSSCKVEITAACVMLVYFLGREVLLQHLCVYSTGGDLQIKSKIHGLCDVMSLTLILQMETKTQQPQTMLVKHWEKNKDKPRLYKMHQCHIFLHRFSHRFVNIKPPLIGLIQLIFITLMVNDCDDTMKMASTTDIFIKMHHVFSKHKMMKILVFWSEPLMFTNFFWPKCLLTLSQIII